MVPIGIRRGMTFRRLADPDDLHSGREGQVSVVVVGRCGQGDGGGQSEMVRTNDGPKAAPEK